MERDPSESEWLAPAAAEPPAVSAFAWSRRAMASAALVWALAGATPSCSLLLNSEATQCRGQPDCSRFPGTVCDVTVGICVASPFDAHPATKFDASDGGDAPTADAGPPGSDLRADATPEAPTEAGAAAHDVGPSVDRAGGGSAGQCPDLDGNGVMDCLESLVPNPGFNTGIAGWASELGMTQAFEPSSDGEGNPASGSLAVTNTVQSSTAPGSTMGGSSQCFPATGAASYDLYLETAVTPQADGFVQAGAAVAFYETADCSGPALDRSVPDLVDQSVTGWQVLYNIVRAPQRTASFLVRLVVVKPFAAAASRALFDNILLEAR